ncbi:MAG: pilus (MSHA type) biogenesis protein MshL [Aquabacterium sp.]
MTTRHHGRQLLAALALTGLATEALALSPRLTPGWREALQRTAGATASPVPMPTAAVVTVLAAAPSAAAVVATPAAAPPAAPVLLAQATPRTERAAGRFDISVNNAPAAQVFMQLGQGTPFNVLVSPDVSGSISITLKDVTLLDALEALRDLYGYDFKITGNRIVVYPNAVTTRLFRINYLPGRRQGASDIRVTSSSLTQAPSNNGSASGGGNRSNNGGGNDGAMPGARSDDTAHVRTSSDADFWREVQASLNALVGGQPGRGVVLNPAAGVIVVKASPAELRQVEQYLKAVQISVERQVMLEAKIVEVTLTKDAQTGINWSGFNRALSSGNLSFGAAAPGATLGATGPLTGPEGNIVNPAAALAANALGRGFYGLAFQSANFAALLNFLQTQGDVSVLSSPRIATLNNQKAVLKVGSDELYVTGITTSTTTTGTGSVSTPSVQLQPFFSGIALDVTPQIDEAGNVMMHVHPAISTVTEKNKNIDLGSLGSYRLPLAASTVNETDSIVRVKDGQIVAIGGLMLQETRDERTGLPGVSEVPVIGGLFRQTGQVSRKRELVILIKPTVIHEDGRWPDSPLPVLPAK